MRRVATRVAASDFTTALCIIVPPTAEDQMQELRKEYDPGFRTWGPPHIKLLWPVGVTTDDKWDLLRIRCEKIKQFDVSFTELILGEPGDGRSNMYCPASLSSVPHLREIQKSSISVFTEHPPTRPFSPSVYLGRCDRRALLELNYLKWSPVSFTVTHLTAMKKGSDGIFRPRHQIPLSGV